MTRLLLILYWMWMPAISMNSQTSAISDLFIPREIQNAYENGTRSKDGGPGPNYWQNHSSYDISVKLLPEEKVIEGRETVVYTNNSPDHLYQIVINLLYDIHRKGNPRDNSYPEHAITDGVKLRKILVNDQSLDLKDSDQTSRSGTHLIINLSEPLKPGARITLYLEWQQPLPPREFRIGWEDSTTSFVGYWYPQIAVYDDIDGWDLYNYRGMAEFYSDLADYSVEIEVPESYTVWATGELQNAAEVFPKELYDRFKVAGTAQQTVRMISKEDRQKGVLMKKGKWHFKADSVPDFAFIFSDHYLWDAISLQLADRRVLINTFYPEANTELCKNVAALQRDIMRYFSEDSPGVAYPYPVFSTFFKYDPGGGMEFPMFANNGTPTDARWMAGLVAHEMHHTWFPFYVRINEKKHGWMDEGWADFSDRRAVNFLMGESTDPIQWISSKLNVESTLGSLKAVPLITPTEYLGNDNYGFHTYTFPFYVFSQLPEILGEETFLKAWRGYIDRWKYKSPTPHDFFFTFNELSGQNLNWYWNAWFFEYGYPDLELTKVEGGKAYINQKSNKPVPVELTVVRSSGDTITLRENAGVWSDGKSSLVMDLGAADPRLVILNAWVPDSRPENNFYLKTFAVKKNLDEYEGDYRLGENSVFRIRAADQHLMARSFASGNHYLLLPEREDEFLSPDGTFRLRFERDAKGRILKYVGERFGDSFEGKKMN